MLSGAVLVIAQRSITDLVTALLALATVALLWCFKKIPEPASCWWPRCWD
jgi:chromate transporter